MYLKRIGCGIMDSFIIVLIGECVFIPIMRILNLTAGNFKYYYLIGNIFLFLLISLKDLVYRNASVCKKKYNLEIKTIDNKVPSKLVLYLRNFTMLLWPIEVIMILFFNKRLGDIIFKTKVCTKS